jgi:hypothetical protein
MRGCRMQEDLELCPLLEAAAMATTQLGVRSRNTSCDVEALVQAAWHTSAPAATNKKRKAMHLPSPASSSCSHYLSHC